MEKEECTCPRCQDDIKSKLPYMRTFKMIRHGDESGVSGTGCVVEGVLFHNGQVVICWRTDIEGSKNGWPTLGIYPNYKSFKFIHITSHPTNGTEVIFDDGGAEPDGDLQRPGVE